MQKEIFTASMSSGESVLRASNVSLNQNIVTAFKFGKKTEAESKLRHTSVMTRGIDSRAQHVYTFESGKCTLIFQSVAGDPLMIDVVGKNARFSSPFVLEKGDLQETAGGQFYPWSFVGPHLVVEDAQKVTVTLKTSARFEALGVNGFGTYTVIQVTL